MFKKEKKKNIFDDVSLFGATSKKMSFAQKGASVPICAKNDKSINDFDSSLILENIDLSAKNKAVKINLKINALERELARITEQVELMCLLNLDRDKQKREKYIERKNYIEKQLKQLKEERKNYGVFYSLADFLREKINLAKAKKFFDSRQLLVKKFLSIS